VNPNLNATTAQAVGPHSHRVFREGGAAPGAPGSWWDFRVRSALGIFVQSGPALPRGIEGFAAMPDGSCEALDPLVESRDDP